MNTGHGIDRREQVLGGLWGAAVGDALGVPIEFRSRESLQANPVKDLRGHGTHNQPPGTWSDDTSLSLCTIESLLHAEFNTQDMGCRFAQWMRDEIWTPWGYVFDVGLATTDALMQIENGIAAEQAGRCDEHSNGNGSLMRILPVALRFSHLLPAQLLPFVHRASCITHGHIRSQMSCGFHALTVSSLMHGASPAQAFDWARGEFARYYVNQPEMNQFKALTEGALADRKDADIFSTGYVLHTLEASLWCLLTTNNYEECVLKAVNLGGDADTTGCVAGGLAGVYYGIDAVPEVWRDGLARADDLRGLFQRFSDLVVEHFEPLTQGEQ